MKNHAETAALFKPRVAVWLLMAAVNPETIEVGLGHIDPAILQLDRALALCLLAIVGFKITCELRQTAIHDRIQHGQFT